MATPGRVSEISGRVRATDPTAPVAKAATRSTSRGGDPGGYLAVRGGCHRVGDQMAQQPAQRDHGGGTRGEQRAPGQVGPVG